MYGLRPDVIRALRIGLKHGATMSDICEWSQLLVSVAKEAEVSPEWVEKALFSVAAKCRGGGLELLRSQFSIRAIDGEFVSARLWLISIYKCLPLRDDSWFLERMRVIFRRWGVS